MSGLTLKNNENLKLKLYGQGLSKSEINKIINTIEADLTPIIDDKADKATTLEGYGITNGVSKDDLKNVSQCFIINVTIDNEDNLTKDASYEDILEAYEEGKNIFVFFQGGDYPDMYIPLVVYKGYYFVFSANTTRGVYCTSGCVGIIEIYITMSNSVNMEIYEVPTIQNLNTKADKTSYITFTDGETLVLNNNQQAHCNTPITELVLSVGDIIDDVYTSNFSFTTGDSISLTYPATPIFWMGDDCDSEGSFTPEPNTGYEISIKRIGDRPMPVDGFIPNLVATVRLYNGYYYQDNEDGLLVASEGMYLRDYRIYGDSVQYEEPSIDNPVEIQNVGVLVTDENDVNYGKYKIPITTVLRGGETTTINIYLDEPLRRVGDSEEYADYIDFRNKKVVRNMGVYTFNGSEKASGTVKNDYVFGVVIYINNSSERIDEVPRKGLCNYLPQDNTNPFRSSFAFHNVQSHPYVYLMFSKAKFPDHEESAGSSSGAALKVIKELYDSGNPLELYYQLQIPTEEPIELPKIPTYKGTNEIQVRTGTQPSAVYYQYYKRSEMI